MSQFLILLADETPNLSPLMQFVSTWGAAIFALLAGVAAVVIAGLAVIQGFKLARVDDPSERREILKKFVWMIVGFLIAISGSAIAGVLSGIGFNS